MTDNFRLFGVFILFLTSLPTRDWNEILNYKIYEKTQIIKQNRHL